MDGEFYRDTWVEVDLSAIEKNIRGILNHLPEGVDMMAVVKANAYGHGAIEVAELAIKTGVKALAVATLDEALSLRKKGINTPILVLGYCSPVHAPVAAEHAISLTVFQNEWLQEAEPLLTTPLSLHVKCDTGMGRIGIRTDEELRGILATVQGSPKFQLEGMFTHFAKADSLDSSYVEEQLGRFQHFLDQLDERPKWIHASNSAATLIYPKAAFNLVRVGIAMYGLAPSSEIVPKLPFPLHPAFTLHSKLSHVKRVEKGAKIGYGCTYIAEEDEWIGTIPIGYADGWLRALQGQEVLIRGKRVPIVGRICMDQCMVRLPEQLPVGTPVTLIGRQENEEITVDEIAEKLNTINYEVVCQISNRVPRLYKYHGETVKITTLCHD